MRQADDNIKQFSRYARVARNSQMLLVMEPPRERRPDVEEAREAIATDALDYLTEVEEGVESPYFSTYGRQDAGYLTLVAAEKIRREEWDRRGRFDLTEPRIRMTDSAEAQAASFAYLAASCMRQFKAPFYVAPSLRTGVTGPRNLAEFVETVSTVRDVTIQARDTHFHEVVGRNEWRVAFVFWEATKWLAQMLHTN